MEKGYKKKQKNEDKLKSTERILTIQNTTKILTYHVVDEDAFEIITGETAKCAWNISRKTYEEKKLEITQETKEFD